jgi:hypothetical protein
LVGPNYDPVDGLLLGVQRPFTSSEQFIQDSLFSKDRPQTAPIWSLSLLREKDADDGQRLPGLRLTRIMERICFAWSETADAEGAFISRASGISVPH